MPQPSYLYVYKVISMYKLDKEAYKCNRQVHTRIFFLHLKYGMAQKNSNRRIGDVIFATTQTHIKLICFPLVNSVQSILLLRQGFRFPWDPMPLSKK